MPRPHCSLILAMLLLWQSHYSAAQPALEGGIGFARPCGEDNLSCPRLDEALQCYTQAELCNGIQDCDGGSDEGQDLVSLECKQLARSTNALEQAIGEAEDILKPACCQSHHCAVQRIEQ